MSVEIVDSGAELEDDGDTVGRCEVGLLYSVLSEENALSGGVGDEECAAWYWVLDIEGEDEEGFVLLQ
jgi:hypothetical protein